MAASFRRLSPAGTWVLFDVAYPIFAHLLSALVEDGASSFGRYLRGPLCGRAAVSTAAHPYGLVALGFLESASVGNSLFALPRFLRRWRGVANRMFHHGQKLRSFGEVAAVLAGVCAADFGVAPYFVFTPALTRMSTEGPHKVWKFRPDAAGEHFQKKWLDQPDSLKLDVLMVADFSRHA